MDQISLKLRDWQQQIQPWQTLLEKIYASPLVILSLFFAAGILIQAKLQLPLTFWFISLLISTAAAFAIYNFKKSSELWHFYLIAAACFSFLCFGSIRYISYKSFPANHINQIIESPETIVTLTGSITSSPQVHTNNNWLMRKYKFTDPSTSFYLDIDSILSNGNFVPATGTIKTYISEPVLDLAPGDQIELLCKIKTFSCSTNPGQFDVQKYMQNKNVNFAASARSRNNIKVIETQSSVISKTRNFFQSHFSTALLGQTTDDQTSSLLEALLLGNRSNIQPQTTNAFKKTGLLHFISLSGLHIAILLTAVWFILNPLLSSRPAKALICIFVIFIFLLTVPPRAPTVRACIIAMFFCIAIITKRSPSPFNSLALAFLSILLITPTEIYSAGFQLSFACVTGILLFSQRINRTILSIFNIELPKIATCPIALLSTGIAAWLGGFGIILYHFNSINFLAPLWTVITFPFIALTLVTGLAKIVIAPVFPTIGLLLTKFLHLIITALTATVNFLADLLPGQIIIGHISITIIIGYYLLIILAVHKYLIAPNLRRYLFPALTTIFLLALITNTHSNKSPNKLILTCLDIGAGQSIIIQTPKENFIFDAGSLTRSDPGNSIVNPFLEYSGISRINHLFISHDDIDHFNAVPEIVSHCKPQNIFINSHYQAKIQTSPTAKTLHRFLNQKNIQPQIIPDPNLPTEIKRSLLWPTPGTDPALADNDLSSVYLLEYAGKKILICSDIEKQIQHQILDLYPDISADILVLPHHGSASTISADFVNAINPQITIASCAKNRLNSAYKPAPPISSFYTAQHGSITVTIDQTGQIITSTFLNP